MPKPKVVIRRVLSPDTWRGRHYYDWVVIRGKQGRTFYGYRRKAKNAEKEARAFARSLPR